MGKAAEKLSRVLYLPHGGGPLPLLGDPGHKALAGFLKGISGKLGEPSAIIVISAHWEEDHPAITSASHPEIVYDYYGFPAEAYTIRYDAPGDAKLAEEVHDRIKAAGIQAKLDEQAGFDHGMFVPLKLMYPDAGIPCIQLSLLKSLDPAEHISLGRSIASVRKKNVLIVGSGMSFHNLRTFFSPGPGTGAEEVEFDDWLLETCANEQVSPEERESRLIEWEKAPSARYCHPREEHLLPLHVCCGCAWAETPFAEVVFNNTVMGKKVSGFLW